jgi:hypothetical protein
LGAVFLGNHLTAMKDICVAGVPMKAQGKFLVSVQVAGQRDGALLEGHEGVDPAFAPAFQDLILR